MLAQESLQEGNVQAALQQLQDKVRKDPADAKLRIFLFQLLSITGQWDRALNQLNVVGELDDSALAMVTMYREALGCESFRAQVFQGKRTPLIFGEPEQWVAKMMQGLQLDAQGQHAQAQQVRAEALDEASATGGTINGQTFEWIADADSRLGPILEAIINGSYYWVPFNRISQIDIEEPVDLRDMVWTPVHFTWSNGGQAVGIIPTRYAGSESSGDGLVQLARKTDWLEMAQGDYAGLGQRMLATDQQEYSLLEIRKITLHTAQGAQDTAAAQEAETEDG